MDISYETTTYGGVDQRWVGGDHGFDLAESATVLVADLKAVIDQYGYIKGGTLLAKVDGQATLGLFVDGDAKAGTIFGAVTRDVFTRKADTSDLVKVALGVIRHGRIHQGFLPVPAQRAVTTATPQSGELIFD